MKRRDILKIIPAGTLIAAAGGSTSFADTPLSIQYLGKVRALLTKIRSEQAENLLEAAHLIAHALIKGRSCWYSWDMGHSVTADLFAGRNGVPDIIKVGYDRKDVREGDVMLASIWSGVHAYIGGMGFAEGEEKPEVVTPAQAKEQGVTIIGAPSPWSADAAGDEKIVFETAQYKIKPSAEIWIETGATQRGAIMQLPGAGAPMGPVSGVVGMATFWMIAADVCRLLAREGMSRPVDGDEPKLSGDLSGINLDAPLMDDYFTILMKQLEMIAAEAGYMKQAASLAVDTVLEGGKVYGYSRDRNSLAYESQTRRGGLTITKGLFLQDGQLTNMGEPFTGKKGDTVIMGLDKPNCPVDLAQLAEFRKRKMKVITIGPMTRDIKVPDGPTAASESDVHIGRGCDSYGVFALPGFERKICPTSGAVLNQSFWALCFDMAEEIMRRTGNTPGVYLTGAVESGIDHLNRVNMLYDQRGY